MGFREQERKKNTKKNEKKFVQECVQTKNDIQGSVKVHKLSYPTEM